MKKFFTILLFFSFYSAYSQTTIEERNYCETGYKFSLDNGLDIKKGYSVKPLDTITGKQNSLYSYSLIRNDTKKIAAVIVNFKSPEINEFFCIPHPLSAKQIINETFYKFVRYYNAKGGEIQTIGSYFLFKLAIDNFFK